jgi:hypothetical protein
MDLGMMLEAGWTETAMRKALGLSRDDLRKAVKDFRGLAVIREAQDQRIRSLRLEGQTVRDIAKIIKLSRGYVSKRLNILGLITRTDKRPVDRDKLRKMVRAGYSLTPIANEMGFSRTGIRAEYEAMCEEVGIRRRTGRPKAVVPDEIEEDRFAKNDRLHVEACLAHGGFVRVVRHGDKTYWVRPGC